MATYDPICMPEGTNCLCYQETHAGIFWNPPLVTDCHRGMTFPQRPRKYLTAQAILSSLRALEDTSEHTSPQRKCRLLEALVLGVQGGGEVDLYSADSLATGVIHVASWATKHPEYREVARYYAVPVFWACSRGNHAWPPRSTGHLPLHTDMATGH